MALAEDRIAQLSTETNCEEIARLLTTFAFSWDIERALELALFRSYAVPSISGLLMKTREFADRPRKRYDDTELLISEPMENGIDSARGRAAIGRINEMHGQYRIANDDMLYVLCTFVLEPIRWLDRFGRRGMTAHERAAWANYHRRLGARMGIAGIPADLAEFEAFAAGFERDRFRFAPSNAALARITLELLLSRYLPRRLHWFGRPVALSLMDAPLLAATGLSAPSDRVRDWVLWAMRGRARLLCCLPRRRRPRLVTARRRPGYPAGYRISDLGTWPGQRQGQGPAIGSKAET